MMGRTKTTPARTRKVTITLSDYELKELQELARQEDMSVAAWLRDQVRAKAVQYGLRGKAK